MQVAIYSKILSIVKALSSGTSEILHGGHKQWVDVLALRSSKEVVLCSVQLSKLVVPDSEKPGTAVCQASLSTANSQSLLKLMSIESVMPSNHLILCRPLRLPPSIFPRIRVFSKESVFHIKWPSIGVSASASVLPMNIWDWFPLGWTGWISLHSKGL